MKIMIATGGSGGHIFPALSTARHLKNLNNDILLVGVFPQYQNSPTIEGFPFHSLSAIGLSLQSAGDFLKSSTRMMRSLGEAFSVIRNFRPDCVCGFGGYGAFPVVLLAAVLRFPSMIHEQNVVPGRANRILGKLVRKIAVSFKDSKRFFPKSKVVWTGSPCQAQFKKETKEELLRIFGLESDLFTFLVVGGSQGSRKINTVFVEALPLLKIGMNFQVIHLCGKNDPKDLIKRYQSAGVKAHVLEFLKDIGAAYQAADCVIARAGAGTIMDVSSFKRPCLFIPYPFASGHQKENARVLVEQKVARLLEEKDLTAQTLKSEIDLLMDLHLTPSQMAERFSDIALPDAADRIAQEILELGIKRGAR